MVVRERLCVELGAARVHWDDWCKRRGLTAGEGVRQLIASAIRGDADGESSAIMPGLPPQVIGEPRSRIEIRLTIAELSAVEQCAAASGLSSNRWIVSLVRAQLTREPQLGEHELRALSVSSQQLAGISRLLGQLARTSGTELACRDLTSEWEDMRKRIDHHLHATAAVIRANLDRWSR
ncbi:plasmid-related protein [Burkholderia lata]|uniref:Plasmid-related protein n=1 Tax=Burkholderia lata (strain ATCC 17760 / DSM 23089 / LMG 22485 / NCIMB 9086 / R18194 / 383) TaxID=482957 RepID=A0A6P2L752_BURL3|nr:plasmid stabilization protein [Burkholderia lata]VWB62933.1 plasmid-related protein [Burkholderia lata]